MNFFLGLMLMTSIGVSNEYLSPEYLRSLYYKASQNSSEAERFYDLMKDTGTKPPLLLGYKSMAEFMKCYHSYNPVNKLTYFYKGKADLDKAISLAPNNVELRYLRFTVQTNLPPFLNYKGDIEEDKKFLMQNFMSVRSDAELHFMIREYMINSDFCSEEEKIFFKTCD